MTKRDKLRRKLRNNPKGRNRQDIETLLKQFGFILDRVTGSHYIFVLIDSTTNSVHRFVIPIHGQQVKTIYVKQVIEQLDEIFPITDSNETLEDDDEEIT